MRTQALRQLLRNTGLNRLLHPLFPTRTAVHVSSLLPLLPPQCLGLFFPQQPTMHDHATHVINRHHSTAQRQHVRRVEGQALVDGLQVIAEPVDFLMQRLHLFIGQVVVVIVT